MYFHNMDVVKIKCGNNFSEIEAKGHQPVLTVFHIVKTKKAKLQYFLSFFSKFQFFLLNNDIFVRKLKSNYRMSTDFYVLLRLKKCGKSNNIFLLLNYMINFISNFTVEMLLKYNGIHWDSYPTIKKMGHQKDNLFYLIYKLSNDKGTK
jgi:hypothetical protein